MMNWMTITPVLIKKKPEKSPKKARKKPWKKPDFEGRAFSGLFPGTNALSNVRSFYEKSPENALKMCKPATA